MIDVVFANPILAAMTILGTGLLIADVASHRRLKRIKIRKRR